MAAGYCSPAFSRAVEMFSAAISAARAFPASASVDYLSHLPIASMPSVSDRNSTSTLAFIIPILTFCLKK